MKSRYASSTVPATVPRQIKPLDPNVLAVADLQVQEEDREEARDQPSDGREAMNEPVVTVYLSAREARALARAGSSLLETCGELLNTQPPTLEAGTRRLERALVSVGESPK